MSATPRHLRHVLNGERRGFITPVTLPVLPSTEEVAAFHRARLVRKRAKLIALGCAMLAIVAALLFGGCAHVKAPAVDGPPIVLSDRTGSAVGAVIETVVGQRPLAMTLPGWRPIVLQPSDAHDECLIAHELVHEDDQREVGPVRWAALYVGQLYECERGQPREWCLRNIPLEEKAYSVERTCVRVRRGR